LNVGAKKLSGTVFHASPIGEKHRDMLNNSFAQTDYNAGSCSNLSNLQRKSLWPPRVPCGLRERQSLWLKCFEVT